MTTKRSSLTFDREDHEILEVVNPIISGRKSAHLLNNLLDPSLHPRGIKELAAPKSLRLACAMIDLVKSLEDGLPEQRLRALRSVHDEVLRNGSPTLTRNTARVLLQIIKELVRAHGDERQQLMLAHDFRQASSGNPRIVRRQLRKYHLLEMPEDWSQLAFDHHVHDANSKGRKSPTHLVMDAWIKGIRTLSVVYYHFVRRKSAAELLEAAEIMGLRVRVGVEFSASLRGKAINIIWAPRGFKGREDFISFLEKEEIRRLMADGRAVAALDNELLLERLARFNETSRLSINEEFGLDVPPLDGDAFLEFVGDAQASSLHLAEFVHAELLPHLKERVRALKSEAQRSRDSELVAAMDGLVPEEIGERYLPSPKKQPSRSPDAEPLALLDIGVSDLLSRLEQAPRGHRVILNPSHLSADEVIEALYQGRGRITHLEVFNVKDWAEGRTDNRDTIARIRLAINSQDPLQARQLFLDILHEIEEGDLPDKQQRVARLREMLADLSHFQSFYRHSRLKSRLGSDSTGRSRRSRGMGLVGLRSLPLRSRCRAQKESRLLPVRTNAQLHVKWVKRRSDRPVVDGALTLLRRVPVLSGLGYRKERQWIPEPNSTRLSRRGNIASLGGAPEHATNDLALDAEQATTGRSSLLSLRYLNTTSKNVLKVLAGLVPAFLTFLLTKEWWLLAYFGAPIWFAITGLRNIVQSVLGGGGLFRSSLLKWSDFVSWGRIADSLLYTGFSVPLLDYLVKTLLLDRGFNINTATNPVLLYSVIALANGIYITSHNVFRGLPAAAAIGNFFRTVISIPLAIALNASVAKVLELAGVPATEIPAILQLWAAVISKAASDVVAGFIEGLADRGRNVALRGMDFRDKRRQVRDVLSRLGLLFPEQEMMRLLDDPKQLVARLKDHEPVLTQLACNALDCMFIWMRQPRGRYVFRRGIHGAPEHERSAFFQAQRILERKRTLSELCVAGMVGKRYDKVLAFYLGRSDSYLRQLARLQSKEH